MSDEAELDDFEPDQDDEEEEREDDAKDTDKWEDEKEEEDFFEEWIPTPLTMDKMKAELSLLSKTGHGLAHAYTKLGIKNREPHLHGDRSVLPKADQPHTLELRGNQLESTLGINLPKLKNLFLAQNLLNKVEGLENLVNLSTFHLQDNQIATLSGFSKEMKSLQYLNLRGNMITDLRELAQLRDLPKLRALVLLDNPCADDHDYRQEALVQMAQLKRLDKELYEEEDRTEASEIRLQRLKEEQEPEQEAEPQHDPELDQPL